MNHGYGFGFLEGDCLMFTIVDFHHHWVMLHFRSNRCWFLQKRGGCWATTVCLN